MLQGPSLMNLLWEICELLDSFSSSFVDLCVFPTVCHDQEQSQSSPNALSTATAPGPEQAAVPIQSIEDEDSDEDRHGDGADADYDGILFAESHIELARTHHMFHTSLFFLVLTVVTIFRA
jgi:hypothetical protein